MQQNLISMTDFVFMLRNRTTSELCRDFSKNFKTPVWNGSKDDMVKDMLAIDAIQWRLTKKYAKFLIQPLALWMFVPCEQVKGVWVPMEKPNTYHDFEDRYKSVDKDSYVEQWYSECKRYQAAKDRCLFTGWKLSDPKKNMGFKVVYNEDFEINLDTLSCYQYVDGGSLDGRLTGNTIDAVANLFHGIALTPTALKMIYG